MAPAEQCLVPTWLTSTLLVCSSCMQLCQQRLWVVPNSYFSNAYVTYMHITCCRWLKEQGSGC